MNVILNLLKPTGYVMLQQVKHSTLLRSAHTVFVFCIYLRTNSDLCHLQHKLIGFYNRVGKCLQRGTDWGFKIRSLRFVFRRLKQVEKVLETDAQHW